MGNRTYTLEEIERQMRGIAALVACSQGLTGKIIIHKAAAAGAIRVQLDLEGDPATVTEAAGILAACTK